MKLTKLAQALKTELALELAKQGQTLQDFDQMLKTINTGEGVLKIAVAQDKIMNDMVGGPLSRMGGSMGSLALNASLASGAAAGLTLDEMDGSVDMLNKSLEKEREKIKMVKRLTANLKREHGLV